MRANQERMAPVRELMRELMPDGPRMPSALEVRAGGARAMPGLPRRNKAVDTIQGLVRTFIFLGLFLLVCKLTHFRQKMLYDARINRRFLAVFYTLCTLYIVLYTFMLCKLRLLRPPSQKVSADDWDKTAPIPMYAASGCLALAVVSFIFALWPCFQFATFLIGTLGFITMIFVLQWLPV
jgi:hypothetical protein